VLYEKMVRASVWVGQEEGGERKDEGGAASSAQLHGDRLLRASVWLCVFGVHVCVCCCCVTNLHSYVVFKV
jgi:hypothetical protein